MRICAGFDALKFFAKSSGMTTMTSSRRVRTASSASAGPSAIVDAGLLPQPVDEGRRVGGADDRDGDVLDLPLAARHVVEQEEDESRAPAAS